MLPCTCSCEAAGEAGESGTLIWGKREPWKLATFVPVSALLKLLLPILYLHVLLHMIILQFRSRFLVCAVGEIQPRARLGLGEISALHRLRVRHGWLMLNFCLRVKAVDMGGPFLPFEKQNRD